MANDVDDWALELFSVFAMSNEFKLLPVHQEEKLVLTKLLERVWYQGERRRACCVINILLQVYISQLKLNVRFFFRNLTIISCVLLAVYYELWLLYVNLYMFTFLSYKSVLECTSLQTVKNLYAQVYLMNLFSWILEFEMWLSFCGGSGGSCSDSKGSSGSRLNRSLILGLLSWSIAIAGDVIRSSRSWRLNIRNGKKEVTRPFFQRF